MKPKKQIEERLLKELQVRNKKAKLAPDKFSCINNGTILGGDSFENEIKSSMVEVHDVDEKGFMYIKVNPKVRRDILLYLVDKSIDEYSDEILSHKAKHPGLKMKDFINRYYRPIIYSTSSGPFLLPNPALGNHTKKGNPHKRFRSEQLKALEVWEFRRARKTFPQIAKILNIKEPTAKKRFYKAYELLFGRKYNPSDYEKPEIKKKYLRRTCKTCKERQTCTDLCPDVIEFVGQEMQASGSHLKIHVNFPDPKGPPLPAKGKGAQTKGESEYEEEE